MSFPSKLLTITNTGHLSFQQGCTWLGRVKTSPICAYLTNVCWSWFFFGILSICFQVRLRHQDVLISNFCFTHTRVARHQHESTEQLHSNLINHSTFFIDFPPQFSQWISNVGWQLSFSFFFFLQRGLWNFLLYYSMFTVSSSRDFTFITRLLADCHYRGCSIARVLLLQPSISIGLSSLIDSENFPEIQQNQTPLCFLHWKL